MNRSLHYSFALIAVFSAIQVSAEDAPSGKQVKSGASIALLTEWPAIAKAPKSDLATIECWIKPDVAAIDRPRSFVITLSNRGGRDSAGLSITFFAGKIRASVFGTRLTAPKASIPDKWTHVALTINTKTINKQAKLWIDGKLVAETLVLERWPQTFEVAQMLSDRWNQGRVYSGTLGDVRFSKVIRYEKSFKPPNDLPADRQTSFSIKAGELKK
ncbi:MAG: hypothetical protein CMJ78_12855 [Planctomycetaceae bacterium]|nr:hypothetical protein [Planctomycetaceae bacterium]